MEMKLRGTGTIATLYVLRRTCCSYGARSLRFRDARRLLNGPRGIALPLTATAA
jgi:hypothetical protein